MKVRARAYLAVMVVAVAGIGGALLFRGYPYWRAMKFPSASEQVVTHFAKEQALGRADYLLLAAYFTEGFVTYANPEHTGATYPGYPSGEARRVQDLEAFARIAPLLAVYLATQPTGEMTLPSGRSLRVDELLETAVRSGTDPSNARYWGQIKDHDQRTVEAADVALALWISKRRVWDHLDRATQERIATWLFGVNGKNVVDNNWHLFIAQVNVVLKSLGQKYDAGEISRRLDRIKSFYRGNGWFTDGPDGPFDYYNAWGFHYQLGWIRLIDPELMPEFIEPASDAFAHQLLYLIGTSGFPIMGRSVCYRLAVSAPLMFAAMRSGSYVKPTVARRALDATWQYFAREGAIKQGRVTQGYCGDDPRSLDDYSGPASCLWSLRSLIVALMIPADSPFWTDSPTPLPIETSGYRLDLQPTGFRVVGTQASGNIVIRTQNPLADSETQLLPYTLRQRILDSLLPGIRRPANENAKYRRAEYSSGSPFCTCKQ